MRPDRNDPNWRARLMNLAKKGSSGGSAGPSASARAGGSPQMSVSRSQAESASSAAARGREKRRAEEQLLRDTGKRRAEEEPRRDMGKRPASSFVPEAGRRTSVGPQSGPLKPWVDAELVLSSYHELTKRLLKVEVVEGLFTEEMGYSGMTLSALEDQMKATVKLFIAARNVAAHREFDRGKRDEHAVTVAELNRTIGEKPKSEDELELAVVRLEAESKKYAELMSSVSKLPEEKRNLRADLSHSQKELAEAKQKIETLSSEQRSCYDDAVKDFVESVEYEERLAGQRVQGYFDLIEKVGEKYPSLDWSFLDGGAEEVPAEQGEGGDSTGPCTEPIVSVGDPASICTEPVSQGAEPIDPSVDQVASHENPSAVVISDEAGGHNS
ncbi:PREDICTED: uncharacterized protein LOC103325102 [Prunus mume]|uniref:Uncharacterized protein LOC103325102 n=1 Tax=Prunus mume TaxID=102107 RepID=A0ABM0NIV8_PRUMU|nr:PREDICTED: uncharacterized protein LOC103325102 [Prunus mume]XP_008225456.1 PREDICTED: uncharacterized protein LOC103325102 [Prunus mume]